MILQDYDITIKDRVLCTPEVNYEAPQGVGQYILKACEKFATNTFQICPFTGASLTFAEYKTYALNVAANLRHLCDVKQGDLVLTCMKNSLRNAIPIGATFFLNAVSCSLDPTLSLRDCEYLIKLAEPKVIVLDEESYPLIQQALENIKYNSRLIINPTDSYRKQMNSFLCLDDLMSPSKVTVGFEPVIVTDPINSKAGLFFSSGSTGLPKAICLTHRTIYFSACIFYCMLDGALCNAIFTTFYWVSGMSMFLSQFLTGSTKVAFILFEIQQFCTACIKYKVEGAFLTTTYIPKLLQAKELMQKSYFTVIMAGGVTPSNGLFAKVQTTFPKIHFNQAYGMTECGGPVIGYTANYRSLAKKFPESTGFVLAGWNIKVIDKNGKSLGPNEKGEICCRSKYIMMGYKKDNTENPIDKDGFLHTGDLGYYDENKLMYITGKKKDMFKYLSWHIVPAFLESIILEHPAVNEVCVFGTPHETDGFLPSAAVILHKNQKATPEEIARHVATHCNDRQKLRGGVFIRTEFPKTPAGKVQRNKVADMILKEENARFFKT